MSVALGIADLPVGTMDHKLGLLVLSDSPSAFDGFSLSVENLCHSTASFAANGPLAIVAHHMLSRHEPTHFLRPAPLHQSPRIGYPDIGARLGRVFEAPLPRGFLLVCQRAVHTCQEHHTTLSTTCGMEVGWTALRRRYIVREHMFFIECSCGGAGSWSLMFALENGRGRGFSAVPPITCHPQENRWRS